jgi:hypothetical protein
VVLLSLFAITVFAALGALERLALLWAHQPPERSWR